MPTETYELTDKELDRIYSALASEVQQNFGITPTARIFRSSGLLPSGDQQHWAPLMAGLDRQFREFSSVEKSRTIRILAQHLVENPNEEIQQRVRTLLRDHGFQYLDGAFVRLDFFDEREMHFLPASSLTEFSTALTRLIQGDLDGALTSACGAVENAAADVYRKHSLGDISSEESFQKKVGTAIEANGKLSDLKTQLVALGWRGEDAEILCKNLKGSLNQASYVLQTLRSRMSDAHGGHPALESVVFDALKLASVLVALMK